MTRYLTGIKTTWDYIGGEEELRSCLDRGTVTLLEGRCPKLSAEDMRLPWEKQKNVFPTISVARVRSTLARIQTIDYTIPSIHTFVENTKILEPCGSPTISISSISNPLHIKVGDLSMTFASGKVLPQARHASSGKSPWYFNISGLGTGLDSGPWIQLLSSACVQSGHQEGKSLRV